MEPGLELAAATGDKAMAKKSSPSTGHIPGTVWGGDLIPQFLGHSTVPLSPTERLENSTFLGNVHQELWWQ